MTDLKTGQADADSENTIAMMPPGSTIGILGGGQLGRMLALSAAQLGMKTMIFCPDPLSPAFDVTPNKIVAEYDDEARLIDFANAVDVVTYEFENVPVSSVELLAKFKPVAPGARALSIAQDRIEEKRFLTMNAITVAPYKPVNTLQDLIKAIDEIGTPVVLKTARMGYDGKGQRTIKERNGAAAAFSALNGQPLVVEAFIPFEREISVIVARSGNGQIDDYTAAENVHRDHILKTSTVPANIDEITARRASRIAHQIVGALDYVGVLGVEFFVVPDEPHPTLLVNEIAPRVHNSGHWTQAACMTNQFEQHIRAICNWPLGDTTRYVDVEMENLIGSEVEHALTDLKEGMQPHFYGKAEVRSGRKMGHLNRAITKTDIN